MSPFAVEGHFVQPSYADGDAGHGRRLGSCIAQINDGDLNLTSQGGAPTYPASDCGKMMEPAER